MEPEIILAKITALRNERSRAESEIERIDADTRAAIEAAFAAGIHNTDIIEASQLSKARVYQIRKGTRR
ncbi:hypothetical protein [Rhodococcus sp. MALMAid1271]|uniref:hypothetical protein n=1 Tax=Rhodococcus sp. MALMAid1271 TaxID=3411744 RepID=UPI003BA05BEF